MTADISVVLSYQVLCIMLCMVVVALENVGEVLSQTSEPPCSA